MGFSSRLLLGVAIVILLASVFARADVMYTFERVGTNPYKFSFIEPTLLCALAIRPGDMIMRDADGICCSILYGQDNRSPISVATTHVELVAVGDPRAERELTDEQAGTAEAAIVHPPILPSG